jgi:all-trans-retinol 13,14-reductase
MNKTAVIIGGGVGGLCTACLLSREGYKVTVLERHYTIGGGLHTFVRGGVEYETGMHYISGFEPGGVLRRFFSYIGIFDRLQIRSLDTDGFDVLHIASDDTTYRMPIGKENFINWWAARFPDEAQNIRNYVEAMFRIADRFPLCNLRTGVDVMELFSDHEVTMPTDQFIARYIHDSRLQNLLAWINPLYGGIRGVTPAYVHAIVSALFIRGASRFSGSSQQMADLMCDVIRSHGGEVICSDGVKCIHAANREVDYVETEHGKRYSADVYVSSLHPSATVHLLSDPAQLTAAYRHRLDEMPVSDSAFLLFVKLKSHSLPYINHNIYFARDYKDFWRVSTCPQEEWPVGFMVSSTPDKSDDKYARSLIASCPIPYEWFAEWADSKHSTRPQKYLDMKHELERRVLGQLSERMPEVVDCIDSYFSATPLTIRDYTGSKNGSLYGYIKDSNHLETATVSPLTKIHNLNLTGQNINLHGILGTPLNAIITTGAILHDMDGLIQKIARG